MKRNAWRSKRWVRTEFKKQKEVTRTRNVKTQREQFARRTNIDESTHAEATFEGLVWFQAFRFCKTDFVFWYIERDILGYQGDPIILVPCWNIIVFWGTKLTTSTKIMNVFRCCLVRCFVVWLLACFLVVVVVKKWDLLIAFWVRSTVEVGKALTLDKSSEWIVDRHVALWP